MRVSVVIGVVFFDLIYFVTGPIVGGFISDPTIIELGQQMLKVQVVSSVTLGVLYIFMLNMQVTGKSGVAILLSLSRQGLLFIPTLWFLNLHFGFDGLIWAQPVADGLTFVVVIAVITWFFNHLRLQKNQLTA